MNGISRRRNVTIRTYPAFVPGRKLLGRAPEFLPSADPSVTSPPRAGGGAIASSDRPLTSKKNSSNPARRIVVTYRTGTVLTFLCVCGTPLRARKIEHRFRTNRTLALARTKMFATFSDHAIRHLKALWARVDQEEMSRAPVRYGTFRFAEPTS